MFGCESSFLLDKFFTETSLLDQLFEFIKNTSLNHTLAGYFSKLVLSLLNKNASQIITYIDSHEYIPVLTEKICYKSISDIILKILLLEHIETGFYLDSRIKIVNYLIPQLKSSNHLSHYYLSEIVSEFLQRSIEANSWREIVQVFTSADNLKIIIDASAGGDSSKVCAGVKIIKSILNCSSCDFLLREDKPNEFDDSEVLQEELEENNTEFLVKIIEAVSDYAKMLKRPSEKFLGTFNKEIEILGEDRLKIIDLMLACIKLNNKSMNLKIAETGIIEDIMQLFFRLEMNSMLHNLVENLVFTVFTTKNEILIENLIEKTQLIKLIVKHKETKGNSGHSLKIANFLVKIQEKYDKVRVSFESCTEWGEYFCNYLSKRNEDQNRRLGEGKQSELIEETGELSANTNQEITAYLNRITGYNVTKSEDVAVNTEIKELNPEEATNKKPEIEENIDTKDQITNKFLGNLLL